MDWLIGVVLVLVGAVIGFFVAKYVYLDSAKSSKDSQKEQTLKDVLVQQSFSHVAESRKVVAQLEQQCQVLNRNIDSYEKSLELLNIDAQGSNVSFFGEHASPFLQHKEQTVKRVKDSADVQPLDFSNQSSGLFSGTEGTTPEKQSK
ncbi:ZapG family protein [Paraglaciecola polaris]|uniref:DUF1043 domain-containing protein n=1 Tax=Paraglaciecola polaris LMG 21857 TaxID=1129793 RepID=K7AJU5_9ALTE|nr:DUF1043 family protein [Paraglaciecola polaris]GAC35640.1 hypothetical protein GPLA_4766 [Paraglaciecola polaris LMG 21857]